LVISLNAYQIAEFCSILFKQPLVYQPHISLLCVCISELKRGNLDRGQFTVNARQITLHFTFNLNKFVTHFVRNIS